MKILEVGYATVLVIFALAIGGWIVLAVHYDGEVSLAKAKRPIYNLTIDPCEADIQGGK